MRRSRRKDPDAGLSLVELLVAMALASILLIGIGVVFLSTIRGVTTIDVKTATTADARTTMEAMTRSMRVAFKPASQEAAIVSAYSDSVSFYALLNRTGTTVTAAPDPTLVRFAWNGTCLTQTLTPPRTQDDGSLAWDTGAVTTCLARTSQKPQFSYYLTGSTSTAITVPATGLTLTDRKTVHSIGMTVYAQDATHPEVAAVPLIDRVTMSNLAS